MEDFCSAIFNFSSIWTEKENEQPKKRTWKLKICSKNTDRIIIEQEKLQSINLDQRMLVDDEMHDSEQRPSEERLMRSNGMYSHKHEKEMGKITPFTSSGIVPKSDDI